MNRSFRTIARSELGLVRDGNEDSALISPRLIAVADGMGGHAGGEVASKIAIKSVKELSKILNDPALDYESREDLLLNISFSIDQEIAEAAALDDSLHGMGTTLTALHLNGENVELLHIGDSRCYQWNGKKLVQLSYDHTVMQELIDQGRLTPDEVVNHPQRSLLTQALIGDASIDPILHIFPAKVGDQFLLCTDGLSSVLSDHEITNIIKKSTPDDLVSELILAVNEKGAPDNVSILWAEIVEDQSVSPITMIGAAQS